MSHTYGWAELDATRKRELIAAIKSGGATRGPAHLELDLTDRCNVACYFCNQQDLRTKESIPLAKLRSLIDELTGTGLKAVRLSGGGDPLFHREILPLLDYLHEKNVVVDNLTTNGVALTPEVAERLVRGRARAVVVSLNAADAADYARMMRVKPALFDQVIRNIKGLVAARGEGQPLVIAQFLLDRKNATRIVEMYDLAASCGVDRIAINAVLEIPLDRIDHENLLSPADRVLVEPYLDELLERDRDRNLLEISFAISTWNEMLEEARRRTGVPDMHPLMTAKSFKAENGGCFFAWYSAAVTGNGDIRPCCLMLNPNVKSMGNIHDTETFAEQWHGPQFGKMRQEMQQVLVAGADAKYDPNKYDILQPQCVEQYACWLKNMFFRGDEEFYEELGRTLEIMREPAPPTRFGHAKHVVNRLVGGRPRIRAAYDAMRNSSRPFRAKLKERFGWNVTEQ